jgi:protein TonB
MPAANEAGTRERAAALAATALIQFGLGLVLLNGLRVQLTEPVQAVQRLIDVTLPRTTPPVPKPAPEARKQSASAHRAEPKPLGGSPGPQPAHAAPSVTPIVAIQPSASRSGGGLGAGPALRAGSGGGTGGQGSAADGGTDLELISGEILPSDYPKHLGDAGIGGRVGVTFTVETNGRVTNCRISHSSGLPELDALTCRLMEQRFRFRPSTDRYGRPIPEEVDWDQDWIAPRD